MHFTSRREHVAVTHSASTTAASSLPPPVSWKHWTSVVDSWLQPQLCPLLFMSSSSSSILFLQSLHIIRPNRIPIYQSMVCVLVCIKCEYRPHLSHQIPTFCWKTVGPGTNVDTDTYQQRKATKVLQQTENTPPYDHGMHWWRWIYFPQRYRSYNRIVTEILGCKLGSVKISFKDTF